MTPTSRGRPPSFRLIAIVLFCALFGLNADAAEPDTKPFDLPAAPAENSLRQFAVQSGAEVLFATRTVGQTRTNDVRGDLTPREAISRLLAGTGLLAEQDARSGAWTISSDPKGQRAAPNVASDRPAKALSPEPDEVVTLSPFTVSTEKDTGYTATNTLAGTRLNTPIRDLGASISVYTREFLDDIGATNANELLLYATGMEAAGPGGNYSGAADSTTTAEVVGDSQRVNPQGATRTRGLSSPNFSRGLFATDIAGDSYNTERTTVIRGPNSILFGAGSPAGVVDTGLISPNLRRDANRAETRFGNNGGIRLTADFNRVLVRDKLAVRLAALHDREEYNQRPAFEEKRRIFGAVTYQPFSATSLRANFETGNTRANRPINVLPFDSASSYWHAAGRPGFDWTFYDDPSRNPAARTQNAAAFINPLMGQGGLQDSVAYFYSQANATQPDMIFRPILPGSPSFAANAVAHTLLQPLVNRDAAADTVQFLATRNVNRLPAAFWTGANVLPGQQTGQEPAGIKAQGFTDFSAFDFKNRMIDESSTQGDSFHAFNVSLEQRALRDHVGIEVAYDTQRVARRSRNSFFSSANSNHVYIDTNAVLSTGQPNPNYGRPFALFGQSNWSNNLSERETWRATAFARYDFKDAGRPWMKWLGRHVLTGLVEENAVDTINYQSRLATSGEVAEAINPNIIVFGRRPAIAVYMGPSLIGNTNPLTLSAIQVPRLVAGSTAPATYFVRAANRTDPGDFGTGSASLVDIAQGGSAQREVLRSAATAFQSYWLQDHLVTVIGWRRDEDYYVRRVITAGSPYFDDPRVDITDPGKAEYGFKDLPFSGTPPPNVAKNVVSYSAVLKWPQKLLRLPAGTDFSVFYNESENFTPIGGRTDSYLQPIPSPEGKTNEYGFNLYLFDGKFSLRYNRFETSNTGQSSTPAVYDQATRAFTVQLASYWLEEGNRNPENVPFMNAAIERLFSTLPANYRAERNLIVSGTAPNLSSSFSNPGGGSDTVDFTATGDELELVYNPTSKWRILANVSHQETVQNNSYPVLREFLDRMIPVWNSSVTDPVSGKVVRIADIPQFGYATGTGPATGASPAAVLTGTALSANVYVPWATAQAQDGTASAEQRKWRLHLVTNYRFGRDSIFGEKLLGWSIGGTVRWEDKLGIGYPTTRNSDSSVSIDLKNPYYAPAQTNVDVMLGYTRKIFRNRLDWRLQFNVRNLISGDALVPITVQPWGETASARLGPERRWYVTNSFGF